MDVPSTDETVGTIDSGLAPGTILKRCENAQNGVSVENVFTVKDGYHWYVFRADHGRVDKAYHLLEALNADTYLPRHTIFLRTETGVKKAIKNMLPYFVFAYLPEREARLYVKGPETRDPLFSARPKEERDAVFGLNQLVTFYYDHFKYLDTDGTKNPPLIVPDDEMKKFIIATLPERDVIPVEPGEFEIGEEVEVVAGIFKGLVGKVIRENKRKKMLQVQLHGNGTMVPPPSQAYQGKRRLLFQLPCLGTFGSAYIPISYFRKLNADDPIKT